MPHRPCLPELSPGNVKWCKDGAGSLSPGHPASRPRGAASAACPGPPAGRAGGGHRRSRGRRAVGLRARGITRRPRVRLLRPQSPRITRTPSTRPLSPSGLAWTTPRPATAGAGSEVSSCPRVFFPMKGEGSWREGSVSPRLTLSPAPPPPLPPGLWSPRLSHQFLFP